MPKISGIGVGEVKTSNLDALAVTEPKIGLAAVAQGKLKTTSASGSVAIGSGLDGQYALTGGTFSWWTCSCTGGYMSYGGGADKAAGVLGIFNSSAAAGTFFLDERYVQASPPYNNGPLFVHLAFDSNRNIKHLRVAPDPVHAYHGPTDITPEYFRDGKAYRRVKKINGLSLRTAMRDPVTLNALMTGAATVTDEEVEEVEITLSYKDSDMTVMPHPFIGNDLTGLTVVMLEPGTSLMERLAGFCDHGEAREVRNLIMAGRLDIDSTPLSIPNTPPGVVVVRARWGRS